MLISGFYSEKTLNHHQMRSYSNPVAYQRFMACFQIILLWSYNAALLDELHWLLGGYFLESFMYCFGRQHISEIKKIPAEDQRNAPTLKSNLITSASIFVLNLCYTSERLYSRQTGQTKVKDEPFSE